MPKCYILVGPPAVGKTTWFEEYDFPGEFGWDYSYISSDDVIEEIAYTYDITYNEAFPDIVNFADKIVWRNLKFAAEFKSNIIIDRTNMSRKSRKKYIDLLKPYGYEFEAVVFEIPDKEEWERRLNSRPGKTIPKDVIESMMKNFEFPTEDEGFSTITPVVYEGTKVTV